MRHIPDSIQRAAILGTESGTTMTMPKRIGETLTQGGERGTEAGLLLASAAIVLRQRAGYVPYEHTGLPVDACGQDVPECRRAGMRHLQIMLAGSFHEVLPEWLANVAKRGEHAPAEFLPALLDLGQRRSEWRLAIQAVLSARGRWLAELRDDWEWALQPPQEYHRKTPVLTEAAFLGALKHKTLEHPALYELDRYQKTWSPELARLYVAALRDDLKRKDQGGRGYASIRSAGLHFPPHMKGELLGVFKQKTNAIYAHPKQNRDHLRAEAEAFLEFRQSMLNAIHGSKRS